MTAKQPQIKPENAIRPPAPAAPPYPQNSKRWDDPMMIEFCCGHCGHVKLEPSELHENPRNPRTCTACAVRLCKPLAPPPTVEWIRPSKAERRLLQVLCWMGLAAFWFAMGFFVRGGA